MFIQHFNIIKCMYTEVYLIEPSTVANKVLLQAGKYIIRKNKTHLFVYYGVVCMRA